MKFPKLMHVLVLVLFATLMSCQDGASKKKSTTKSGSSKTDKTKDKTGKTKGKTKGGGTTPAATPTVEHLSKFHVISSETIRLNSGIRYVGKAADADTNTVKGIAVAADEAKAAKDADVEVWLSTSASKYGKYFLDSGKMAEKSEGKKYEHKWFAVKKNAQTTALKAAKVTFDDASVNVPTRKKVTFKDDIFDEAAGFPILILRVYDPDTSDKDLDDEFEAEWKIQFSKATAPTLADISLTDIKGKNVGTGTALPKGTLNGTSAAPASKDNFTGAESNFTIGLAARAAATDEVGFSFKIAGDDVADFTWTITGTDPATDTVVVTNVKGDDEDGATAATKEDVKVDATDGRKVRIDFTAAQNKNGAATLVGTDKYGQEVKIKLTLDAKVP